MAFPLISVLMTAYNREKYIAEAIESVLASTFKDFELIIVDDCSKDRTVEIARRYLADPRVQLHVNEKNLGDYHNRNRAASLARGKHLKYLDSDDVIYPHGLAVMVAAMEQYPDAALALERPPSSKEPYPLLVTPRQAYIEQFLEAGFLDVGPTATIVCASSFHAAGDFSGKRCVGDSEMWLKLAARWPVVKLPQGLIWWRQHDQQEIIVERVNVMVAADRYLVYVNALNAPECPLNAEQRRQALSWIKRRHARDLLRLAVRNTKPLAALKMMRATGFGFADLARAFS
jgi:glycosyltransferase involved in cell wall biosynthesis